MTNRWIRVAVPAIALSLLVGACGGSTVAATGKADVPAGTLLSTKQAKSYTPGTKPKDYIVPPSPSASAIAVAPPTRTPGPPGNPTATTLATPPASGLYRHKITVSGTGIPGGTTSLTFDVQIHEPAAVAEGQEQLHEWKVDAFPQKFTYEWRETQLLLTHIESTQPDGSTVKCDLEPPDISLKLPLEVGRVWTSNAKCKGDGTRKIYKVLRTEKVRVGSEELDAYVVEARSEDDTERCGKSETVETTWYAPSIRMFLRSDIDSTSKKCGDFQYMLDLLETTPRPPEE